MNRKLTTILSGALFAALLSSSGAASAGPPVAPRPTAQQQAPAPRPAPAPATPSAVSRATKVNLQVMVVYATSSHSRVDSRLSGLTRYLSHLRYSGYELLDTQNAQLGENGSQSFTIEGGRKMTVTLLSRDDARARMRVEITASGGKLLDTTLSVNRNGTFIVAGPKHKDGILVLPLTARY